MNPSASPSCFTARSKLVQRMQDRLQAQSWPRVQMALVAVAALALVGWGLQQAAPGAETLGQALGWAVAPGRPR